MSFKPPAFPSGWALRKPGRITIGASDNNIDRADLRDRRRIWEVRRYCQVKPSLATYDKASGATTSPDAGTEGGDYALTAILQCVLMRLGSDLAFISLLDEDTQYFIASAKRLTNTTTAQAPLESTQWYGCDAVAHAGGLCHRTIHLEHHGIYEELDMSIQDYTKELPFVNGEIARFKHYAGVPIVTANGYTIGTVFVLHEAASAAGLDDAQREFFHDSTTQIMKYLDQAVQALEWRRLANFNELIAGMSGTNGTPRSDDADLVSSMLTHRIGPAETDLMIRNMYERAVEAVLESFELDVVFIQEVPLHEQRTDCENGGAQADWNSYFVRPQRYSTASAPRLPQGTARELCKYWPEGEIFYRTIDSEGAAMYPKSFEWVDNHSPRRTITRQLALLFHEAQQMLAVPLWDPVHERISGVMVGIAKTWTRLYSRNNDLIPLSVLFKSILQQARRLESQHMDQRKTDFMGSVSHEMRSPLHGMLANVELLLATTDCSPEQIDMLKTAADSGHQLLASIDKVLQYAHISSVASEQGHGEQASKFHGLDLAREQLEDHRDLDLLIEQTLRHATIHGQTAGMTSPTTPHVTTPLVTPDQSDIRTLSRPASALATYGYFAQPSVICDAPSSLVVGSQVGNSIQTIIANLLSNSLKNTTSGCIRVAASIEAEETSADQHLVLSVTDTGRGIPKDFLKHKLFTPFSQDHSLETGVGIGLSLVKLEAEALSGTVKIDSDEASGTTVTVRLPQRIVLNATSVSSGQLAKAGPIVSAQIYASETSLGTARATKALGMLHESLDATLTSSTTVRLRHWESTLTPDMLIVLEQDLAELHQGTPTTKDLPRIVLCSRLIDEHVEAVKESPLESRHYSPYLPSQIIAAVNQLLSQRLSRDVPTVSCSRHDSHPTTAVASDDLHAVILPDRTATQHTLSDSANPETAGQTHAAVPAGQGPVRSPRQPAMLLVDDNAINLKVLAMYTDKCGAIHVTQATGGQEAIEAHNLAMNSSTTTSSNNQPFDIIFMDLSMPGVSGFDATAAIRRREAQSGRPEVTYIVALTGLVSEKDRRAAFEAGVDRYLTKPAKMKDIQGVIDEWRELRREPA